MENVFGNLKIPIQTLLSVAPKFQIYVRPGEKFGKFSKTSTSRRCEFNLQLKIILQM